MAKTREWLPKILVESFLIAFSILLALWVDDWKEVRENQQKVREAVVNFERRSARTRPISKAGSRITRDCGRP